MQRKTQGQRSRNLLVAVLGALGIVLALTLSACSATYTATSSASCAFAVGNGQNGNDASLDKVLYPGQTYQIPQNGGDDSQNVTYFPCSSRNYVINDGSVKNANGQRIGDRFTPSVAYTRDGTPIFVWSTAYFTVNQSQLNMFYQLCAKYTCASDQDKGGTINSSTAGWNSMLGENFGPAIDQIVRQDAASADDTIWEDHSQAAYDELASKMSADFDAAIRLRYGFPVNLFCGSGNSSWANQNTPGKGAYTCTNVRFTVDKVTLDQADASNSGSGNNATALNAQRVKNAQQLYGDDWEFFIGLEDTIGACKDAGVSCVLNIGSSNDGPTITPSK